MRPAKLPKWAKEVESIWLMAPANRRLADVSEDILHAVDAGLKRINRAKPGRFDVFELCALTEALTLAARVGLLARGIRVTFDDGLEPLVDGGGKHVAARLEWDERIRSATSTKARGRRVV